MVLPDSELETAQRMINESGAGMLAYGYIHTPYQRRVGKAVLLSVGAVNGSNDSDPRPAYTIVELGAAISVEVRRVDCPAEQLSKPGPFPVRSQPGVAITLWP